MSEHEAEGGSEPGPETPVERTGNHVVDDVIASVEALRDRPLEDHAAVFEAAQDALRRALDPQHEPSPGTLPRPPAQPGRSGRPGGA